MIEIIKEAAIEAGKITLALRKRGIGIERKGDASNIITEADTTSEKIILEAIKRNFPTHAILSEESGRNDKDSEYCWVIDPVDGTIPYSAGLPTYGISIGLLKDGKPYLGVINLPALGELYWSEAGKGAFLNGKRISVSKKSKFEESLVGFELGWMEGRKHVIENLIEPLALKIRYAPILGCASAALCYVAAGVLDGYVHRSSAWDFVAGAALIQEAGGKVTDHGGKEVGWFNEEIPLVVSNGLVHRQILETIKV
jgi:myo-inositol-1(or 4)-monophosphatase